MSFISNIFKGASNNFTPNSAFAPGTQATTQDFAPQIATANANYGSANSGLQDLAQQLQLQSQGGGPNLANALLQQATGQNVANQAALAAGQRGASSNVGLIARQAGQQGAQIQQQAAGQASINRLQQQLSAQSQLGGVLGTQGSLANQNYGITQGGQSAQNAAISGNQQAMNQIGSQQGAQNAKFNQDIIGGVAGAGAKVIGLADGGVPMKENYSQPMQMSQQSMFSQNFLNKQTAHFATGGMTQPPSQMGSGLHFAPVADFKRGGRVPGKPMVQGNDPKNDTVPAMLSPQEIVIPNSVTQSKDPVKAGAEFIAKTLGRKGKR